MEDGQAFYTDVKGRLARYGRSHEQLLILPAATFILGDTDAEAAEIAHEVRLAQVSPATAIKFLEQLWNRDLSDHDPDGRCLGGPARRREHHRQGPGQCADAPGPPRRRRQRMARQAEAENITTRELIVEVTGRQSFIGSPATVAESINHLVQSDASDGSSLSRT